MTKVAMSSYDLFASWFRIADWCAYDLAKDGCEAVVLKPLGVFTDAATTISKAAFESDDYMHRKAAASLAGWIRNPTPNLLANLFDLEAGRDASLDQNDAKRLDSQSVVEDIVFSATRWARDASLRQSACNLLSSIVRRTIDGHYWNTSSYAIVTLVKYNIPGTPQLLRDFSTFANGPLPQHPSRPSLAQEKSFAENLLSGNPKTLSVIENVLDGKDQSADLVLEPDSQAGIDALLSIAGEFTKGT